MSLSFRSSLPVFRRHRIAQASLLSLVTLMASAADAQSVEPAAPAASAAGGESTEKKEHAGHTLGAVTARAKADATTEKSGSLTSDRATLFKGEQSIRSIPQPVTVLTREFLDDRQFVDLQDVIANTPGLTVDYTDSERVNFFSRGYQIDALQVDGLTMVQGGSVFVQPDPVLLDRVEVLRGASGMLRGSGNPSATVNMVRKRPTSEFQGSAGLTLGSWNRRRVEADVSSPLNETGTFRGRVVAAYDDRDFFQEGRSEEKQVFYGVMQADVASRTTVTASLQHMAVNASGAWGNLPSDIDGSSLNLPRETYLGADWNQWNRYNQQGFVEVEHRLENDWSVRLNTLVTRMRMRDEGFKQTYITRAANETDPYRFTLTTSVYTGDASDQRAGTLVTNGPFEAFGRKHEAMFGVDAQRTKTVGTIGNPGTYSQVIDIRNFPTNVPEPVLSNFAAGPVSKISQEGLYGATRLSITDPLSLMLGGRMSWYGTTSYKASRELTPYYGLVYDITEQVSGYASYTEIFTPQNVYGADNQILDPIRGEDYEIGLKGEFNEGRLNAQLSIYRINNVGKAVSDTSGPVNCGTTFTPTGYCQVADGETESRGFDLELSGELMPRWQLMGGYTNNRTRYIADSTASNVGKPLRTNDPKHVARIFTTYRLGGGVHGWKLGGGANVQSKTYVTSGAITARQGGYTVWNAVAGYDFNKKYSLQLNVNNVFDKVYYKKYAATGISNYYGDPRNFQLSMRASF